MSADRFPVMGDSNDVLVNKLSNAGEHDTAVAVKLSAGWVLTGEFCEVCATQVICNRMNQTYCVACFEWRKTSSKIMDSNVENQSKKTETATSVPDNDDALSSIKSLPSRMGNVGIKPKDIQVSRSNLEVCVRSPRESARQKCILQQKFFCSVPPIVDDESGPINAALWEEGSKIEKNFRMNNSRQDLKFDAEKGSPRAVLEGPESSGWSESSSRKSLLSFSFTGEVGTDYSGLAQPSQKHCMQSLWRSFATKKWQSFPSSYRKKELSISDPVLMSPSDRNGEEGPQSGLSDQECVDDLLSVSYNAKRSWQTFSYEDISLATNNFDPENLVGKGGYAKVFKGVLRNGQLIAVKKHSRGVTAAEKERDFLIELGIVSHVSHTNVAKLLGICIENGLHLVFQFSTLGSLQPLLHSPNNSPLSWEARIKVAVGVAKGLYYLHEQCQRRIIHRDIKASNILLDSCFEPQISDFGLSKWLPDRWTHHTVSPIEGTFGYLAPEYFMHGIVDEKTDVFSYGVLLLELITGRRPVDSDKQNLVIWAKPHLNKGDVDELADPRLDGSFDAVQMRRMVLTAALCVRPSAPWRPSMSQVVQLLSEDGAEKKSEHLTRLVSRSHDFACSDTESQEDYGYTDDYESDMQRHRALALEFE
ncbi:receptor-like cytosolic serine/threonine-protein kinase RBK2 isoform X5 [Physcomitrium patens]|uniref:receptor-like cytosolic serine/threonine-protein kinase RBK2 isoform X5 n=1 Tax=Physcomitrium patens TaxID=3218 RepID=UPI003CCE5187